MRDCEGEKKKNVKETSGKRPPPHQQHFALTRGLLEHEHECLRSAVLKPTTKALNPAIEPTTKTYFRLDSQFVSATLVHSKTDTSFQSTKKCLCHHLLVQLKQ